MSRYLVDRLQRTGNVELRTSTEVRGLLGDAWLEELEVEDNRTGAHDRIRARALFVFIGAEPRTGGSGVRSRSTRRASW